jgi:hypothetical protein
VVSWLEALDSAEGIAPESAKLPWAAAAITQAQSAEIIRLDFKCRPFE